MPSSRSIPRARVAAETLTNTGLVVLAGEISIRSHAPDYIQVARDLRQRIGYDNPTTASTTKAAQSWSATTSNDIAQGVDHASDDYLNIGAGDQRADVRLRLRRNARC